MEFPQKSILLKNGHTALLRAPGPEDAAAVLAHLRITSGETDYMLRYPHEVTLGEAEEAAFLAAQRADPLAGMAAAFVGGVLAANAGFSPAVPGKEKCRHRAVFGVSVKKEYWGLGLGTALVSLCAQQAKSAGFTQLELDVVAENARAVALYEKCGFVRYGTLPCGFRLKSGKGLDLLLMALAL